MYIVGLAAFLLCFLHDCNDWKFGKKYLNLCFPLGALLIVVSTIWMCMAAEDGLDMPLGEAGAGLLWLRVLLGLLGIAFGWAEIYSLFFSFDRKQAYVNNGNRERRTVNTFRMYALCRHPGVLFFLLLYLDIWLCVGMDLMGMLMLCVLNLLLAVFEDFVVFPEILGAYEEYRETSPFIIPNSRSIMRCVEDFRRK